MKAFAKLYLQLDETTSSNAKLAAMAGYFRSAPPEDSAWRRTIRTFLAADSVAGADRSLATWKCCVACSRAKATSTSG